MGLTTPSPTSLPKRARIPFPPWPHFDDEMIDAATAVLRSGKVNYWTGDECRNFEAEFAAYVGSRHAIAVANGTVALELALHALGIGPGDEVVVPSRTFIATASAVAARGARPVVADIDRCSQNITADTIRPCLSGRTRAVIAVHLAGWPCDMDPIMKMARVLDIKVIEDCAQAHGARYRGKAVGSLGDVAAFSFCQDKIVSTAGEGGMVTTNDSDVWQRAWSYKDHGKDYESAHEKSSGVNFRWLHSSFGTNWRFTEMQAAIGRVALRRLPDWVAQRRANAEAWAERLAGLPALRITCPPASAFHSYYKYYAFVHPAALRTEWSRDRILQEIANAGVPCGTGSCAEIYLEQAFPEHLRPRRRLRTARDLGETSLMFQVHPTLSRPHVEQMADIVAQVVTRATDPAKVELTQNEPAESQIRQAS